MSKTIEKPEKSEKMQDDDENLGLGCALERFSEIDEVLSMIESLKCVYKSELSVVEKAYEKFLYILDQYHEQPHLLDPHLDTLLEKLCEIVRNENPNDLKNLAYKYMYVIIKVRGYKIVVRHLPHEVSDFEPILRSLEKQDPSCSDTWTTRYVLLLWLSIIVKIPFHMSRLDDASSEKQTVTLRMFEICKIYAVAADKCRDAAAYLGSQFLIRGDIKNEYLPLFFDWACNIVSDKSSSVFAVQGALSTIAMILKHGKREDLLPHAGRLLRFIINTEYKDIPGTQIPKLGYKIMQRIGLIYLKPRIVAWRYQRGNRTLAVNLSGGDGVKESSAGGIPVEESTEAIESEEDIVEVPDEIEDVIDELMQGLKSTDGVVRWSAAKGIGRVTGRLSKDLADEVLGSVLELFNPREGDEAWHGGCLTLAELGRRGLLLPQRLPEVVPVVVKALMYDEPRGYASVGAHVRDAACYVAWAFARAYDVEVLRPYVTEIAQALLIVAVFDREINCRRAASAAFQENVGRQGAFPYGIEILTVADFFAVGSRQNAYLNISVFIAQYEEYTTSLIDHLIEKKVDHWDSAIRELTAKALHNLTEKAPEYMANTVLDKLLGMSLSIDLNARHGSVLAISEILLALSPIIKAKNTNMLVYLKVDIIDNVRELIPRYRERLYFRGLGGEMMKQACATYIQKCSQAHVPFHDLHIIDDWLSLLSESLSYEVPSVRISAIEALPDFFTEYYSDTKRISHQRTIIDAYISNVKVNNKVVQMGHLLALGSLPGFMLKNRLDTVLKAIIDSTEITEATLKWSESRRDALKALTTICTTLSFDKNAEILVNYASKIYECFFNGLTEYTQDNRGDIGAWVREAAMTGIQVLTLLLCKLKPSFLDKSLVTKIIAGLVQQAVEKIDRTRALAGRIFSSIIHCEPDISIPHLHELRQIFPTSECDLLNWNSEAVTFPKFVELLPFTEYTYNLMLGLIVSIGGLTETLVKSSSAAFFAFVNNIPKFRTNTEVKRLSDVILDIFTAYQKNDRITVPMFRFLEKLLSSGCLQSIIDDEKSEFPAKTVKLIQLEISGCKDVYKLIDGISVLCQFIQIPKVCPTALVQLSILLCHRHTYVRKSTSSRFYEALLVHGESTTIPPENVDDVMTILSETDWEESVESVRPMRNQMCDLMGVRVPIMKAKK